MMASVISQSKALVFHEYSGPPNPKPRPVFRPPPNASQKPNRINSKMARDYTVTTSKEEYSKTGITEPTSNRNDKQPKAEASSSSQDEVVIISSDDDSDSESDILPDDVWPMTDKALNIPLETNNAIVAVSETIPLVNDVPPAAELSSIFASDEVREKEVMDTILFTSDSSSSHLNQIGARTTPIHDNFQPAPHDGSIMRSKNPRKRIRSHSPTSVNINIEAGPKRHKDDAFSSPSPPLFCPDLFTQKSSGQASTVSGSEHNLSFEDDDIARTAIEDSEAVQEAQEAQESQGSCFSSPSQVIDSSTACLKDAMDRRLPVNPNELSSSCYSESEDFTRCTLRTSHQARLYSSRNRQGIPAAKARTPSCTTKSKKHHRFTSARESKPPSFTSGLNSERQTSSVQSVDKPEFKSLEQFTTKITSFQVYIISPGRSFFAATVLADGDMMEVSSRMLESLIRDMLGNTTSITDISLKRLEATQSSIWLFTGVSLNKQAVNTLPSEPKTTVTHVSSNSDFQKRAEALLNRAVDGTTDISDSEDDSIYNVEDRSLKLVKRGKKRPWQSLEEQRVLGWKREGLSWEEMEGRLDGRTKGAIYLRWHTKLRHEEEK